MVRAFAPEPIDPSALDRVLDAGRRAPAAGNTAEGRAFVVLDDPSRYWDVALPVGPRRAQSQSPLSLKMSVIRMDFSSPAVVKPH